MKQTIFALTSLPPPRDSVQVMCDCIGSWREAGLRVCSFNHPDEIAELARFYDIEFIPVIDTAAPIFGRHLVPIKAILEWAAAQDALALLINADIHLRLADWEIKRIRWLADDGLCYFVRYNHGGNPARATREPDGIDAFLFHGCDVADFPDTFLCMGQPFWDYWLPYTFTTRGYPLYAVEFPVALHRIHQHQWSWENWHRCAIEFERVTGEPSGDQSFPAYVGLSVRTRQTIDQRKVAIAPSPPHIRGWVQRRFGTAGTKTFLELGAHCGTDTVWLANIPGVTIHAFEPDPRNTQAARHNVNLYHAAIAERDGHGSMILSQHGWGQEWTYSSSIKQPKNHLHRFPVSFGDTIPVELVTLDTFYREHELDLIDFIWADVQGAEGEMIRGGQRTLARTRYLYTAYSDDEMYENQATLSEILALLPNFRVIELWADNVLLENRALRA